MMVKIIKLNHLLFIFLLVVGMPLFAQDYPYDIPQYDFIKYEKNFFEFKGDSLPFEELFYKFDSLIFFGKGQIRIIHIGESHVQADIYTGQMRKRLQTFYPGLNAGFGSVFPYKLTHSNTPGSYFTTYTGKWETCRNVDYVKKCKLGLSGLQASTKDNNATLNISFYKENEMIYDFNKIRIFYEPGPQSYKVDLSDTTLRTDYIKNDTEGYIDILLKRYSDKLQLKLTKSDSLQHSFVLYGINLETNDPGIVYNAFGVNGASTLSFLGCQLLPRQIKTYNANWIIISLGVNDVYGNGFSAEYFESNYSSLLSQIRSVAPNTPILLFIPNDDYIYRRRANPNTAKGEEIIYKLAKQYNCGVWNFYQIMGGFNSSSAWFKNKLMVDDRIHFTLQGYMLMGDLLFNAFLNSYDNHLSKIKKITSINNGKM
jgi:lysophospholipase L1-like esterase